MSAPAQGTSKYFRLGFIGRMRIHECRGDSPRPRKGRASQEGSLSLWELATEIPVGFQHLHKGGLLQLVQAYTKPLILGQ